MYFCIILRKIKFWQSKYAVHLRLFVADSLQILLLFDLPFKESPFWLLIINSSVNNGSVWPSDFSELLLCDLITSFSPQDPTLSPFP